MTRVSTPGQALGLHREFWFRSWEWGPGTARGAQDSKEKGLESSMWDARSSRARAPPEGTDS